MRLPAGVTLSSLRLVALCFAGCAWLSVGRAEAATFSLAWDANTEPTVTGYVVSIGVAPGQYTSTIDVGKQTAYQFSEPDPTVTYYFAVRAYTSVGLFSAYSPEVRSTPTAPAPAPAPTPPGTGFTVVWDANTEPDLAGYLLSIGGAPGQYGGTVDVKKQTSYLFVEPDATIPYYFSVRAYNTAGLVSGYSQEIRSVPSVLPSVTTAAATLVSASGATLNGAVNPGGFPTSAYFEYGVTAVYGNQTPVVSLGSLSQSVAIPGASLTGLSCNTTYHFRAVAINTNGTTLGSDATFTTAACPAPQVTTAAATSVSASGAILNGVANPNGVATTAYYEYGVTASYGAQTASINLGSLSQNVAIPGAGISNLACNTTHHFRAVAVSSGGTTFGSDVAFTTAACPAPLVTTGAAISVTATGAILTSTVDTRGTPATAQFEYGLTTQYGLATAATSIASGIGSIAIPTGLLTCGTVHHYRALAAASGATSVPGLDATFTTAACVTAPRITLEPRDDRIRSGQVETLTVQATGPGSLTYQWYIGTSGVTTQPIAGATAASYTTPALATTTKFWVRVSNQGGTDDSRTATIAVKR